MRRSVFAVLTVGLTLVASSALAQTPDAPAAPAAPASPAPAAAPAPSAPAPAPAPPAHREAEAPRPGSVVELPLAPVAHATTAAPKPAAQAPSAENDEPATGPVTGFSIEGRLSQSLSPVSVAVSTPFKLTSPPPFVAFGYRGSSYGVYVGPVLDHYEWGEQSITIAGLSAHLEADVAQSDDRTNEAYVLAGGSVAIAAMSRDPGDLAGRPSVGLLAGMGARHWVTRHLGVGVEIGESFTTAPVASTSASPQSVGAFSTFGTLGITLVL